MTVQPLSLASFFSIEAREYAHFTFDADARAMVRNIIIGFCIGILIAALYAFYQKSVPGAIVRSLLGAEALSPESAKTLAELGLERNPFIRFELKHNGMLRKVVFRAPSGAEEEQNADTDAPDPQADRFYIPEELKYRAELRFEKKGNGVPGLVLTAVLTLALSVLLIRLLPAFLGMIDNLLG
ncbi:MAG: hypothetical protein IJX39_07330 [Clostridia bacterium]|nr:hypothetical protein [Clostridia bacterium]